MRALKRAIGWKIRGVRNGLKLATKTRDPAMLNLAIYSRLSTCSAFVHCSKHQPTSLAAALPLHRID